MPNSTNPSLYKNVLYYGSSLDREATGVTNLTDAELQILVSQWTSNPAIGSSRNCTFRR